MPTHLYPALLLVPGLVAVLTAAYAWRRRHVPPAEALAAVMLAVAVWSLGYAAELASPGLAVKLWWVKLEYLGIAGLPVAWLMFALHYSGLSQWITTRRLAALCVVPFITIALVATNETHHLYYASTRLAPFGVLNALIIAPGPAYWLHVAYSHVLILIGLVSIVRTALRSGPSYHRQSMVVLAGVLAPWVTNALYLGGISPIPGLDFTNFSFTLTGVALAWALFRLRLLDLAPIARDAVFDAITDGVLVLDETQRVLDLNPAAARMLRRPAAAVFARPIAEVLPEAAEVLAAPGCATRRSQLVRDGETAPHRYELRVLPLRRPGVGQGTQLLLLSDITEQERAAQALHATEVSYRDLFNTVGEAVYFQDREGRFLDVNPGAERMYGYPREAFIGQTPEFLAAPGRNDMDAVRAMVWLAFEGAPQHLEFWGRRANGEVFPKEVRLYPGSYMGQEAVIAIARDVTGRKRAEQRVRDALQRFEAVIESAPSVAIQGYDQQGRVQHWNRASEELFGYSAAEMTGQSLLGKLLDEQGEQEFRRHLEQLWTGQTRTRRQEWEVMTRHGDRRVVDSVMFPVHEAGEVAEVFCIDVDITGRRRAEDAQRLAAVGQLAAGVAHEFNNLLAAMLLQAEMTDADNPHQSRELKSVVLRAARRGGATCADLMAFARPPEARQEPVMVTEVIAKALAVARRQLENAQVAIEHDYRAEDACINGDAGHLEQVLLNLLINAGDAMSDPHMPVERRRLVITVDRTVHPTPEIVISVADTGSGIAPEHLSRVFEPFFTTKLGHLASEPQGVGLGLSVSHGIIAAHLGRMDVASEVGRGTTFIVRLPAIQAPAERPAAPGAQADTVSDMPPLRVLLAEDEADVRGVVAQALERLGHGVTAVATTDQALAALDQGSFDVVVTDLMLPGAGGASILQHAADLPEPPPTLVITGKLDPDLEAQMKALGAGAVLQKPFSLTGLLQAIRDLVPPA